MILQNNTGPHDLSFLTSMVDFILPTPISNASGKTFEGIGGNRGYLMSFVHEGEDKQVTITNESVADDIINTAMDPTLEEIVAESTVDAANTEIDSWFSCRSTRFFSSQHS